MKYISTLLLLYFLLTGSAVRGQSFTQNTGGPIPDNNTLTCYPVSVSGLPAAIDSVSFGLLSVCINISHNYTADLDIYLKSPDGSLVLLVNNRGGNGKNFTGTCLAENGNNPVGIGLAPFPGNYIPEQTINIVNNGQNPNGQWNLCVLDEIPVNSGFMINFTLKFGNNPPRTPEISLCTLTNGRGCRCPDGSQRCDLLPDMTNSERVIRTNRFEFRDSIRIGVGTPNIGFGPLEIRGTNQCFCDSVPVNCATVLCPNGEAPKEKVVQRVYRKDSATMSFTDHPAGFMQFHPTHGHTHLDDWTYNSLRLVGPNPDPRTWPIVGTAQKVSFCLVNNFNCSGNLGYCKDNNGNNLSFNDVGNPGLGQASGCGRFQGIFPGYLDVYFPGLDGQTIPFSNLCNGWYNIVSITDPLNLVKEMDETNNIAVVPIFLSQQVGDCCKTDFAADTMTGTAPFTVRFADYSAPLSSRWKWNFGDGTGSELAFPTHTYTRPGVYDVSLQTESTGTLCRDSLTRKKYITVRGAATPENPFNIHAYPNPFTANIKIYFQLPAATKVEMLLFDATGRQLRYLNAGLRPAGLNEYGINLASLPAATYVLHVLIDGKKQNIKLVKR